MKDYCDVLRTSGTDKPIQIEVLRYDTQEVLRGELNTDSEIEQVFSFAEEVGEVEPLLLLDGIHLLQAVHGNARPTVEDLAEETLLHAPTSRSFRGCGWRG